MQVRNRLAVLQAFMFYFLIGSVHLIPGSSLPYLSESYGLPIGRVVFISSFFALGRLLTVSYSGKQVKKHGPKRVMSVGLFVIIIYILVLLLSNNLYITLLSALIGGIGMGTQDAVCPYVLNVSFKDKYASALSAGQILFTLGAFTTPLMVGITVVLGVPFYYAYYFILFVALLMLIATRFMKLDTETEKVTRDDTASYEVKGNNKLIFIIVLIAAFAFSSIVNGISSYTTSFAENVGMSDVTAPFLLTTYNMGGFVGAIVFTYVLRKVRPYTILMRNSIIALTVFVLMLILNVDQTYFIGMFITGVLVGVLFSVLLAIATGISTEHVSIASSKVASASATSEVITPMLTGFLVDNIGIGISYIYVVIMLSVISIGSIFIKRNIITE